ncbi:unnamed protein product [Adineta ricciae]|uniref:MULE transposase domain-containing protein n=1 Tax=Adineta ricciae TaxID=249248 RepID=A0A814GV06_ADIRI|nr:unnamed protein product [Adineta ricciae]
MNQNMYSIVDSQKGSKVIRFQDNFYRLQKYNKNGSVRWICTNRYCSSSITIRNEKIENQRGQHNHNKVQRSASIMKTFKDMRQEVRNDVGKPVTQIYTEFVSAYRHINGTAESVPIFDTIRSTLYRDRSTVLPKHPTCSRDLIVPDYLTKNLYDEMMLFCDQRTPTRILAFCSLSALKELAQSRIWNADGTFKTAPKLFVQSYTVHVHNDFSMKPVLFAVLEDKYETTYLSLLRSLVQYAESNGFTLSPSSILIDFEMAAYNAFRTVFPDSTILFCHFHFAKNIMKHLKKMHLIEELKKEDIKRQLANILSLPLLPPNEIHSAFKESSDVFLSINPDFLPFLNRLIAKPNIWKWIMQIQKDDEQTIIRLEQEKKQNKSTRPRKRKNIIRDICLSSLKTLYQQKLIDLEYYQSKIRCIAYAYIDVFENTPDNSDTD